MEEADSGAPKVVPKKKTAAEKRAFAEKRNERAGEARAQRKLELTQRAPAIRAAVAAYADIDPGDGEDVRIREAFIRLPTPRPAPDTRIPYDDRRRADLDSRPPLTRLTHRKSNGLSVYLSALYVAHLERSADDETTHHNTFGPHPWVTLAGLDGTDRPGRKVKGSNTGRINQHRNLTRALTELQDRRLISAGNQVRGRFANWSLCREDGSGRTYEVPGTTASGVVTIPYWFFRNGWHLVLTGNELAVLFAIFDQVKRLPTYSRKYGAALPTSLRWSLFGLSDEAYLTAHHLADFGLIEWTEPSKAADADYSPEPHRFFWPPRSGHAAIEHKPALDVVLADLVHAYSERMYKSTGFGPRDQRLVLAMSPQPGQPGQPDKPPPY